VFVFSLAVSRTVPLMLGLSAVLICARFLSDRLAERSNRGARWLFAAVLGLGLVLLAPYGLRAAMLVTAEGAYSRRKWVGAERYFAAFQRIGGKPGALLSIDWACALMNQRKWRQAESVIIESVRRKAGSFEAYPRAVLLLGICRYYQGNWGAAEKTFRAVVGGPQPYLTDYFFGRLAERRSDADGALESYRRSLGRAPTFYPAAYQLARLLTARGQDSAAAGVLAPFAQEQREPGGADAASGSKASKLIEREFYILQD
jgi:tetratricopeptide (TPR) repeat protein